MLGQASKQRQRGSTATTLTKVFCKMQEGTGMCGNAHDVHRCKMMGEQWKAGAGEG